MSKNDVTNWETVATYVATYPDGDDDGACDVEVQIGEADGSWYLRTRDDAGGPDEFTDTAYDYVGALHAAGAYAHENHEAVPGEDAADYLERVLSERVGVADPDGEWACYWSITGDGSRVEERYETREQAEAAVDVANRALCTANPSTHLLCGYEVRRLVDGLWIIDDESE